MITIELTEEDAELFRTFRQYQDQFNILLKDGLLDFKQGRGVIHKNDEGQIRLTEVTKVNRH